MGDRQHGFFSGHVNGRKGSSLEEGMRVKDVTQTSYGFKEVSMASGITQKKTNSIRPMYLSLQLDIFVFKNRTDTIRYNTGPSVWNQGLGQLHHCSQCGVPEARKRILDFPVFQDQ